MPSSRRHPFWQALLLAVLDAVCMSTAFLIACVATRPIGETLHEHAYSQLQYLLLLYVIWCFQAIDQRLFISRRGDALIPQIFAYTKTIFLSLVLTIFVLALLHKSALDRPFVLLFSAVVLVLMVLFRTTLRLGIWGLRQRGYSHRRILLIGANERAAEIAEIILAQRHYGFQIMGCLDDDRERARLLESFQIPYLGNVDSLERVLVDDVVDVVYISLPIRSYHEKIESIAHLCEGVGVPVRLIADLFPLTIATSKLSKLADIPVLTLTTERDVQTQAAFKRITDILVSSILILMLSPLFILIAILIKLDSRGPIFTLEDRVSHRVGRTFRLIRFRTRHDDAPVHLPSEIPAELTHGPSPSSNGYTRLGAFLRRYNLDELPELFNIWLGQLSLAEPRPHIANDESEAELQPGVQAQFPPSH